VTDADGRPLPLVVADTAAEAVAVLRNALG
jgi:hypothetical protein